jgi:uncharacterized membrane protein YeaQ/YmgE (transglycosylase-associated protein family)
MGLMVWLLGGLMVAWLTFTFWPKSALGSIVNFSVALLGGLVGGYLSTIFYPSLDPVFNITGQGFVMATLVSLVVLVIFRVTATRVRASRNKSIATAKIEAAKTAA